MQGVTGPVVKPARSPGVPMRIKTDYMRVKAIRKLVRDLEECADILAKERTSASRVQVETLHMVTYQLGKILDQERPNGK